MRPKILPVAIIHQKFTCMANNQNLKPFKPGHDPRRNLYGGPRKLVNDLAGMGYSAKEINSTILNLLTMTESEARAVADGDGYSILERIAATSLLKDMARGSLWNLETLLTRTFGKPRESTKIDSAEKIEVVFVQGKTLL